MNKIIISIMGGIITIIFLAITLTTIFMLNCIIQTGKMCVCIYMSTEDNENLGKIMSRKQCTKS